MPYDGKGKWSPDPEDAVYTDPDASKYINEEGNDIRFGDQYDGWFAPDPPEIVELKKSGEWARMPPIVRRWRHADYAAANVIPEAARALKDIQERDGEEDE